MIAHLHGKLATAGIDSAVIDVNGVGYLFGASARTLTALGQPGDVVTVHTEMLVSEDSIRLMGFATADERDWFKLLTSVQGVGAKVALAILSILPPEDVQKAIGRGDHAMIARANGVGPKLAQRIANELKDKAGGLAAGGIGITAAPAGGAAQDAVSALLNLGFKPAEASNAVGAASDELGQGATLDALVRLALRKAAK
ncbi:Holliday junction branch migration protein RuvA [Sphingomonas sp. HF-S3]|uniref:Holliday junction branch migration complex subunit RuvA n=1 Tax=Sphingomonas rustica TaxID=3103142 RepID=A0ABV0B8C2_9SPHN